MCGRNRVQCRSRFVQQQYFRLDRDCARNAQTLLLAAREAVAALFQLCPPLPVSTGAALRNAHSTRSSMSLRESRFIKLYTEGNINVNRHPGTVSVSEYHADLGAQQVKVNALSRML